MGWVGPWGAQDLGSYLDLFGMEGHNEAKQQDSGKADHALNQEQVQCPLWEDRKPVRFQASSQSPLPSFETPIPSLSLFPGPKPVLPEI